MATPALRLAPQTLPYPSGPLCVPYFAPLRKPLRLSVVVPTFNEANNLAELIDTLAAHLDPVLDDEYEIIVVDDDSPDRTWELALSLTAVFPQLKVIRRTDEKGLASAIIRGWQVATGEVLAVIDADLQHPPDVIAQLWKQMDRGADLAVGSRHVPGGGVSDWSAGRRMLSRGAQLLGLMILPEVLGRVSDPMSGYFMIRRNSIAGVVLNPAGYKILIEVLARGRARWISEVGYVFKERQTGASKVTARIYTEYLVHLMRLRVARWLSSRFLRFAIVGLTGVCVDMGMLFVLSDPVMLGQNLLASKVIAAELAILNNFMWNDAWTFEDFVEDKSTPRGKMKRLLKFNLICAVGLWLNVAILYVLFSWLGVNRYLANGVAILLVAAWNFWLNVKLNWTITQVGQH